MWWSLVTAAMAEPQNLDTVVQALSMRDPVTCEQVEALTPTPTETLLAVVDTVTMPPWAPMQAADCLVKGHAVEIRDRLDAWVTAPELKGLGRLVLNGLDRMPVEVAVPVARKALLEGPEPEVARARILAARTPEVKAIAAEPR